MTDKLNCYCYIAILETIELCAKKKKKYSDSFKNVIYKIFLQIIYIKYIYVWTGLGNK